MKTLRIRTYYYLGLALFPLLPWLFFLAGHLFAYHSLDVRTDRAEASPFPGIAAFAGLMTAFAIVGFRMRKLVLQPLERLGGAARRIADGDLDVALPPSAVREIADVRDGFEIMADGLRRSHRKQAELEEERRFVIAALAHDLRTPLFALRGYLDGLEQGIARTPEQTAKYVAVCKEKSAQLDSLVEELFAFARMEYAESMPSDKTIDLLAIVRRSVESVVPLAERKRLSIDVDCGAGDAWVRGDPALLERAISNVLENAVRYTPDRGRVRVHCGRMGDRAAFTIVDNGPGIPTEDLPRVFEPMYRGEQSRNRDTGGAGLGLTISRRIVRRLGGELTAGNRPEGGAVLAGWLPIATKP